MFVFSISGGFALSLCLYICIYFISGIYSGLINPVTVGECNLCSGFYFQTCILTRFTFFGLMERKFSFKNLLHETTVSPVQNSVTVIIIFLNDALYILFLKKIVLFWNNPPKWPFYCFVVNQYYSKWFFHSTISQK